MLSPKKWTLAFGGISRRVSAQANSGIDRMMSASHETDGFMVKISLPNILDGLSHVFRAILRTYWNRASEAAQGNSLVVDTPRLVYDEWHVDWEWRTT
jgi:hypothetical protein